MVEEFYYPYQKEVEKLHEVLINRSGEVDEFNEYDWHDLCLGFLMGQGIPQNAAIELLIGIGY